MTDPTKTAGTPEYSLVETNWGLSVALAEIKRLHLIIEHHHARKGTAADVYRDAFPERGSD